MRHIVAIVIGGAVLFVLGLGVAYVAPLEHITWGKMLYESERAITVTGTATSQTKNEIAQFSAGVQAFNDDKQKAIAEVNQKMDELLQSLEEFGIAKADLKTQNLNINQNQENTGGRTTLGQWMVNNTVEITLRDISKADALADLLAKSGANNVWGPNFGLDSAREEDADLLKGAIENARKKAETMVTATGGKLGKVITVTEGGAIGQPPMPVMLDSRGAGGASLEPGTTGVTKQVTVTFAIE